MDKSVVNASALGVPTHSTPMKRTGRKKRPYYCDQCPKVYTSWYGLSLHIKGTHRNEFRFRCAICNKGFQHMWHYHGHCNRHHGLRPYSCSSCSASFASEKDMKKHSTRCLRKAEKKDREICCKKCDHTASSKDSLWEHNRAAHGGKTYKCQKCHKVFKWRSSINYHRKICVL